MTDRQPIPRTVRFEVFKRDSFTCQYCGVKAPDAVLQVDHIKPVAAGGSGDPMNLVTSCAPCNGGKGGRELGDNSVLARQAAQMAELNERRVQLEMMIERRDGLMALDTLKVRKLHQIIDTKMGLGGLILGWRKVKILEKWVRKYSFDELMAAIDLAAERYYLGDRASYDLAFSKIPGIVKVARAAVRKPYLPRLFYIRGILRNSLAYVDERGLIAHLDRAVEAGVPVEALEQMARNAACWSDFDDELWTTCERAEARKREEREP
jgi:hypothetical protein